MNFKTFTDMVIKNEQFQTLDAKLVEQARERMLKRILEEFPAEAEHLSRTKIIEIIDACAEMSSELNIKGDELVYRLLRLNFLDSAFRYAPYVQKVISLVLSNKEVNGQARVDFLENNLLARQAELMSHS